MSDGTSKRWLMWTVLGGVFLLLAAMATSVATDRSSFCPTCHEMRPYHDAWADGSHKDTDCVQCHVDSGFVARIASKPIVLKEVWSHFTGDTSFPRQVPARVPDSRCTPCHEQVVVKGAPGAFDHKIHETYGDCQYCHGTTGHAVPAEKLAEAGIYDAASDAARSQTASELGKAAAPDGGEANLKDHPDITCSRCHDLAKTGCKSCHDAPETDHYAGKGCSTCHPSGKKWVFVHPASQECAECHEPPPVGTKRGEHPVNPQCAVCHTAASWAFSHNADTGPHTYKSFECTMCHPEVYEEASCTCHKNGVPQD